MDKFSTLQLIVGAMGVMLLGVSATFAGYWNLFGKKASKQEMSKNTPLTGTGCRQ